MGIWKLFVNHWYVSSLDCSQFKCSKKQLQTLDFKHMYVFADDLSQEQEYEKKKKKVLQIIVAAVMQELIQVLLYLR